MSKHHDPRVDRLRGMTAFAGATEKELERLAATCNEVTRRDGDRLIRNGAIGQEAFVILEGKARVVRDDQEIATVGPGQWIGEMSLVEHTHRMADVIADGDVKLFVFDPREFDAVVRDVPSAARFVQNTVEARHSDG